jgi:hypothetical protein
MTWSEGKKIDAVTTWLITGNLTATASVVGVPHVTLKLWKKQPWWNELVTDIQTESDQELDAKLSKRIAKSLEIINDRLENGDFQYDPKTGQFVRKPVSMKDGWKVANEMIDKRWLIRKMPQNQMDQGAVGDILKNLAKEFAEMAKKRVSSVLKPNEENDSALKEGASNAETTNPVENEAPSQEGQVEVLVSGSEQSKADSSA